MAMGGARLRTYRFTDDTPNRVIEACYVKRLGGQQSRIVALFERRIIIECQSLLTRGEGIGDEIVNDDK